MINKSKLQRLSEDCANLLFCSENLAGDNTHELLECNRIIKQALRKIIIANEIAERMIICVTGLQGTGKTTLMKNYYDIEDDIMNIAIGRGERLPILITEDDVSKVSMYSVGIEKAKDGYCTKKVSVTAEEFIKFSKAENEDSTVMYMELIVPRKYINPSVKLSYMLLPGYEKTENYWNSLIEFSVQCSDTAVFVLTPDKVADINNAQLLEKIGEKFGSNVIYAISHSDLKTDQNKHVKETLMELVNAPLDQEARFVCTGAYTEPELNESWKSALHNAIEMYSADPHLIDQKNIEYIDNIIWTELTPALVNIKKFITDVTDELITGFKHSSWITAFDAEASKLRKNFQKKLNEEFKISKSVDLDTLRTDMQNQNGQVGKYLKRVLFGNSLNNIEESKKLIDGAMKDENGFYRYRKAFSNTSLQYTDVLCAKIDNNFAPQIGSSASKMLLNTKNEQEKLMILENATKILCFDKRQHMAQLDDKDSPTDIMKAIVQCGTQYWSLRIVEGLYSEQYISSPTLSKSELTKEDISNSIQSTTKFAMTILGITGADLIGDGVINFIPALAESLAISVPVAGAIVAGIIGTGAAISLISDYNKLQLSDYYSYCKAISSVYENIEQKYLDMYDDFIYELRGRIENYLIECNGANKVVISKQNALIAIKNIQEDLNSIRKELKDNSYDPIRLIRG